MVVLDIGGVLASNGLDFAAADPELESHDLDLLQQAYWAHRDAYDLGGPDQDYWPAVVAAALGEEGDPASAERLAAHLLRRDADQWQQTLPGAMETVAVLHDQGYELWLLSNAPHPLAQTARAQAWSDPFTGAVFSAEVGLMKPDSQIYALTAERIGVAAEELIFFDDRSVNVEAARAAGWQAEVFSGDYTQLLAAVEAAATPRQ